MDTPHISPVVDLVALVEHVNHIVSQPGRVPAEMLAQALLGQMVRRLHEHGHTSVELVGVESTTPPIKDGNSTHRRSYECSAYGLRQGATLVGLCGARDIAGLTNTATARLKDEMGCAPPLVNTTIVSGEAALRLVPLLSPTRQAEIYALVDRILLSWAVSEPASERPQARM